MTAWDVSCVQASAMGAQATAGDTAQTSAAQRLCRDTARPSAAQRLPRDTAQTSAAQRCPTCAVGLAAMLRHMQQQHVDWLRMPRAGDQRVEPQLRQVI
jgi:hypothetical protein